MMATLVATVGHGSTALWYLTRATGLVSLIVLSATVVLGTVASVGWTTDRWPRFLSQSVHRNLSLFCLALIGIHIVSTVGDGYVPIGLSRRCHPVPVPLPPDLGGTRSPRLRHAPRRRHHQRPPPAHRGGRVARRPLAGLRLLAHRRRPRARLGLRLPAPRGDAGVRRVHRLRRRGGGLATGRRTGTFRQLAARRRRRRSRRPARDHRLRRRRTAATRLVPSGGHVLGTPGPVVGLVRHLVLRSHDADEPVALLDCVSDLGYPDRSVPDLCVGDGRPRRRRMPTASLRSPSPCAWRTRLHHSGSRSSARP